MTQDALKCHVWEMTKRLWNKYIGISDDFKMLKDKWTYLAGYLEPALPFVYATFEELDLEILRTNRRFFTFFNLERHTLEKFKDFKVGTAEQYSRLENMVSHLATYVGILKLAFFQRTVSLEIPQVTSGYPHSPERTVGNESIYIAADKMASAYLHSVTTSLSRFPRWDGFVTYVPSITEETKHGAFLKQTPYGFYHVYLPEASKYSISSYLLLAHEISHTPFWSFENRKWVTKKEYEELKRSVCLRIMMRIEENKSSVHGDCKSCDSGFLDLKDHISELADEVLADFIALKIGGAKTIEALLNEFPLMEDRVGLPIMTFEILVRAYAAQIYMSTFPRKYRQLDTLRMRLIGVDRHLGKYAKTEHCKKCASFLGKEMGKEIAGIEKTSPTSINQFIDLRRVFKMSSVDERKMISCLKKREACPQADPRQILHCYFLISQSAGEERAPFSVTLQSLAHNRYQF